MKLSCSGQCCRNGFLTEISSGDRPVLSVFHEIRCHQANIGTFIGKIPTTLVRLRISRFNLPIRLQGTEPLSESGWRRSQSHRSAVMRLRKRDHGLLKPSSSAPAAGILPTAITAAIAMEISLFFIFIPLILFRVNVNYIDTIISYPCIEYNENSK